MSVYKEEAIAPVDIGSIYIPVSLVGETADDKDPATLRRDPIKLLTAGERHVILGDPGSGKSTILKFLALVAEHEGLRERFKFQADGRLPVLVVLRYLVEDLRKNPDLNLLDYIVRRAISDLEMPDLNREFFRYFLLAGRAILLFDGIDELPGAELKRAVRQRIGSLLAEYPGNTTIVTSRIVGYEVSIRYEALGFVHHRVARLALEEIEEFVKNWYRVRIPRGQERKSSIEDLVAILRDPHSRAISELAENPLLLTIICLVHRVDAVLPDQRVVLFQKCTETLLNTWQGWKYRAKDSRNRSQIEKQNRARMEAIAYWMHTGFEKTDPAGRAIVAESELLGFLVQYIEGIEKPRNGKASELGELFLQFVCDRAGLLIEVGQGTYSFLHLTFQEYLAATHLRKSGELGGMEVVWTVIQSRCGNPRWHEMLRLLICSLEKEESQAFLLERILEDEDKDDFYWRAILGCGCLLDGITLAEETTDFIIRSLLLAARDATSHESYLGALTSLRTLQDREPGYKQRIGIQIRDKIMFRPDVASPLSLRLILVDLGWSDAESHLYAPLDVDAQSQNEKLFQLLLCEQAESRVIGETGLAERLKGLQIGLSVFSRVGNLISVALSSIILDYQTSCETPSFEQLLCSLADPSESFLNQVGYSVVDGLRRLRKMPDIPRKISSLADRILKEKAISPRHRMTSRSVYLNGRLGGRSEGVLGRARVRSKDLDTTRYWDLAASTRTETLNSAVDLASEESFWAVVAADKELHGPILDIMCDIMGLNPRLSWFEALRLRWLPRVPDRITLVDPRIWQRTLQAFRDSRPREEDCRHAASQLLLDTWFYLTGYISSRVELPFAELARLTRTSPSPFLQVAPCLRDLAYGNQSDVAAARLDAMVESQDPKYQQLFREALWID